MLIHSSIEDDPDLVKKAYTRKDLVPVLADLFYTCLEYGPSSGHIEVANYLIDYLELKDNYFKVQWLLSSMELYAVE